jgi:hypothetical protein
MLRRRHLLHLAALALLPTGGTALAHMPHGVAGPNGGQVQDLSPYHGELVARDGELVLFLFDHRDRPADARGASGSATVLAGGRQQVLEFQPRPDGSALVARGDFVAGPGLRVVVQVVPGPGMTRKQARYTPVG